jgi:hypothetical protein
MMSTTEELRMIEDNRVSEANLIHCIELLGIDSPSCNSVKCLSALLSTTLSSRLRQSLPAESFEKASNESSDESSDEASDDCDSISNYEERRDCELGMRE